MSKKHGYITSVPKKRKQREKMKERLDRREQEKERREERTLESVDSQTALHALGPQLPLPVAVRD